MTMSFSYTKLWKYSLDLNLNKTQLRDKTKITNSTLSRLSKNEYVSMEVLDRICTTLNCDISDIVEYVNEKETVHEQEV